MEPAEIIDLILGVNPIAIIDLLSALVFLVAGVIVISGWKRPHFEPEVRTLFLLLAGLSAIYTFVLFLEWSELLPIVNWHFLEDITGIFIPFTWAFVFYVIDKTAVIGELETSRARYRNIIESTSDWIWEVDAQGRYTYTSPRVERILGYTPEELLGKTPFELMPPDEAKRVGAIFEEALNNKNAFHYLENLNLHKDGHEVYLESNGVPILDANGNLKGYRGVDHDVTERKRAELQTRQYQAELDSVFRASPVGIGLARDRKLCRANERFFEITGYGSGELLNVDPRDFYASEQEYIAVGEKYAEAMANGFARIETQWVRKDGQTIDIVLYLSPLDPADASAGFVVAMQDITERKAARRQVLKEKTRAQLYLDVAGVMLMVLDTRGRVELLNKKGCELLGCSLNEALGADWFTTFVPPSHRAITRNAIDRILMGEGKYLEYIETPVMSRDGTERLIAWHNALLRDQDGVITGIISSGEDITTTRTAEKALRQSDEQLRVALSAAKMGTWRWSAATNRDMLDDSLKDLLGLPDAEATREIEDFYVFALPDDRQHAKAEFDRAIREHDIYQAQFRIVKPDGQVRWVLDQGKPFYDSNGKLEYMTGVVVDITERVKARLWYQRIVDASPMGILSYELRPDGQLVLTGSNEAANTILGIDFSQSTGKTIEQVFPELEGTPLPDEYRRISKEGGAYHGDNFKYQDANISGFYEFDAFQTSSNNMAIFFTDVTDRIRNQQALLFTQFAVDHAGESAFWMGQDAKFIYVNDMACQSLGYTRQELMKMTVHDIDPDFPSEAWGDHWSQMRKERTMRFQSHYKTKDGRTFPVEVTANFLEYEGAEYNCAFVRDITERVAAEQHRQIMHQQLESRNDELQSIVFATAHDLRSPLVNISGFTGELNKALAQLRAMLKGEKISPKAMKQIDALFETDIAESVRFIQSGNERMDSLLNGILQLSRVGSASLSTEPIKMSELFEQVLSDLQFRINSEDIEITVQPDLPDCVGDFSMLNQVFTNLLDNAIKYRGPDRAGVIEISAELKDDMVEYSIADNGIGIEPEQLEKVFDLFHRLDVSSQADGEGLGLTIVRRILDRLGGTVQIDSTPGLGTTVCIQLPKA